MVRASPNQAPLPLLHDALLSPSQASSLSRLVCVGLAFICTPERNLCSADLHPRPCSEQQSGEDKLGAQAYKGQHLWTMSSCPRGSLTCTGLRVPGDVCLGSRNGKYCFNLPQQSEPGAQLIAAKGWELAGPPSPPKLSFLLLLGRAGRGGGSRGQQSYVFRGDWLAPGADALGCPDVIGCWSSVPTPIFPSAEPEGWVSGGKGRRWVRRPLRTSVLSSQGGLGCLRV